MHSKGFTLIELLLVVVIIGILAAAVFVALNPGQRLADTRDAARWSDVTSLLDASKLDQFDNGGVYHAAIAGQGAGTAFMIGTAGGACTPLACADRAIAAGNCVDYSFLVTEGYLGEIPVASQAPGGPAYAATQTGYYSIRTATNALEIGACNSENTDSIRVVR